MAAITLVPMKIMRDVWIEGGETGTRRVAAGETVDLPLSEAKKLIQTGVAVRNDPLPGDDQ